MPPNTSADQLKQQLIEDNLKRAFDEKAKEPLPDDLLALLDQLKAQDDAHGAD